MGGSVLMNRPTNFYIKLERKSELQAIDRKNWEFFTTYGIFYPKSDVDRLYNLEKKEEEV